MVREGKSSAIEFDTSAPGRREGRYLLLPARLESSATVVMRELCPSNSSPSFFFAWPARSQSPSKRLRHCDKSLMQLFRVTRPENKPIGKGVRGSRRGRLFCTRDVVSQGTS